MGHTSTDTDVRAVIDVIAPVVERARRASAGSARRAAGVAAS
jgi:cysteine desulfurase